MFISWFLFYVCVCASFNVFQALLQDKFLHHDNEMTSKSFWSYGTSVIIYRRTKVNFSEQSPYCTTNLPPTPDMVLYPRIGKNTRSSGDGKKAVQRISKNYPFKGLKTS